MKAFFLILALAASFLGEAVGATPEKASALDKKTLENYVRHLFVWDSSIAVEVSDPKPSASLPGFLDVAVKASKNNASQEATFLVSKDGSRILRGDVYETAENPFKSDLDKLKGTTAFSPNYGTSGAPVVIVEFSDFECPYCREEAKTLRKNLVQAFPKEVRLYHFDFPLEAIHPWARPAAIAAHCVFKQNAGAFWEYYDWIYEHQTEMTAENLKAKILEWAKDKPAIDTLKLTRCMDTKQTDSDIADGIELGKKIQVNQTPMFFVNGRRMAGAIDWSDLKRVIEDEIQYQKTAKNAGEDCGCSVTLPTIGGTPTAPGSLK